MNYNKTLVFVASCVAIFLFGVSLITLGATLPQLSADYGLSEINKGTLASMLPLGILIGSLVFGPIVDRYSYRYLLPASVSLILIGFLIIALAQSFFYLALSFLIIGTGGGIINGAASALVADFSADHKENKGSNLSLMGAFFGLGALGMPLILNLLSSSFNYRQIIGGIGISMSLPMIFLISFQYPAPKQVSTISLKHLGTMLRDTVFLLFSFVLFFQSGWESLMNNWTTTYLIESKQLDESLSLGILTFFVAIFTMGRFSVGVLLKKFTPKTVLTISSLVALLGGIFLAMTSSHVMTIVSVGVTGFGLAAGFPVVLGIIGDRFPSWSGTAFGIALTIALTGNILINYITGIVTENFGIGTFSWLIILSGLFAVLLIVISFSKHK